MSSLPDGSPESDITPPMSSSGLHLQIEFLYRKFQNRISSKHGSTLTPLYIQHFGLMKPQLKFDSLASGTPVPIGTGTANIISIDSECILHGQPIALKPLKRWKMEYNYLSPFHSASSNPSSPSSPASTHNPAPISWLISTSLKTLNFVCINSATQEPIAKLVVNIWAVKVVGNFYFVQSAEEVRDRVRDEVVVTGLTLMYVMVSRMNNPLNILGSMVASPGRVEGGGGKGSDFEGTGDGQGKLKGL